MSEISQFLFIYQMPGNHGEISMLPWWFGPHFHCTVNADLRSKDKLSTRISWNYKFINNEYRKNMIIDDFDFCIENIKYVSIMFPWLPAGRVWTHISMSVR